MNGNDVTRTYSDERQCIPCYSDSGNCIGPAERRHTPGPWLIQARSVEEDGSVTPSHIANAEGHFVCAVEAGSVAEIAIKKPGTFWDKSPRREANAHLIAAAPELLASLSKAVEETEQMHFEAWMERACPGGDVESVQRQWLASSDYRDFVDEWCEQIDAINKATSP